MMDTTNLRLPRFGHANEALKEIQEMRPVPTQSPIANRHSEISSPSLWQALLLTALAGGMGWGIRGQYGHETGAMMAGLLVGLTLALLFCSRCDALPVARAVAWCTVAMGFGGSMTYAQTIGLTHDAELIGNWAALRWGMLGLAIKGGLWIGFAGTFLGMGLGGVRYRIGELCALWVALLALCAAGIWLLNEPFDPAQRILPRIYFSDDWRWEPNATLKPRREDWGGFLFALIGLLVYIGWRKRDALGWRLGLWGVLGGVLGFPLGQCLQAFHAWNRESIRSGVWAQIDPLINWWNFMETSFGAIMGATLALGLWMHRRRIAVATDEPKSALPLDTEWALIGLHTTLLVAVEFLSIRWVDALYDFGLLLGFIPIVGMMRGRWWPWLVLLPITAIPIAGKTLRQLAYNEHVIAPWLGWMVYVVVPIGVMTGVAVRAARKNNGTANAGAALSPILLLTTWFYFAWNLAFFRFPWPWESWTYRTPNALVYLLCAVGLSWLVMRVWRVSRCSGTPPG